MTETIFALSTPTGRSGVAVVRSSGPAAWAGAMALGCRDLSPRKAQLRTLTDPATGEATDRALVIGFKAPASFTGEDVVEFHIHGGRAVIDSLIFALSKQPGHRMAEPGEFTRRAFENGKLDLTEAEAVADLINAETQAQKAQALAQMEGALSRLYNGWTESLKNLLAHLEADIEFPDEDLPGGIMDEIRPGIENIAAEISVHLDDKRRGELLRNGIHIAVLGAPNAGKSSLVNALARRDVAIVSDIAGTTRDIIEVHLDLGGCPVILSDTAGLREQTDDTIESEGMRRALARAGEADIKLLLFDGTQQHPDMHTMQSVDQNSLLVINKADEKVVVEGLPRALKISVRTGQGMDVLVEALVQKVKAMIGSREGPALTRARHRAALEECHASLERALGADLPELSAEDLRLAVRALGRITGRVDVEDLLDVIFRDFCIGK